MTTYTCNLCTYPYDDEAEGTAWDALGDDWVCPVCGSPKSAFGPVMESAPASSDSKDDVPDASALCEIHQCLLCTYEYDDQREGTRFADLPDDWRCPVCGSSKAEFKKIGSVPTDEPPTESDATSAQLDQYLSEWRRPSDEVEMHLTDIHQIATSGASIIDPMRAKEPTLAWDQILIKGAQLAKIPLNKYVPVSTRTVIGPNAAHPLVLETPIYISHMSFGALSKEAKLALSKGSAAIKTAMCSGEGGIIPESLTSAHKYIFEYVPNKYSVTDDTLRRVDAVEIKIGQSAKPGMGGHLPADKVTPEIAAIRGFRPGKDIISPAHFPDIRTPEELANTVAWLREKTAGKPVGIKLAAGNIEADVEIALSASPDFITIDGRAGATAAAPKFVKATTSVPTVFALARMRKILDRAGASGVSLLITGGLRISPDFAKALAMGADAIAIGTAAMMAIGCQQYRICSSGLCPVGIATQNPELRARLKIDQSAKRIENFLRVSTEELQDFARLTGNNDVHRLSITDLCTTNSEISGHTPIEHV